MEKFSWKETVNRPAADRYPEQLLGSKAWHALVSLVADGSLDRRDYAEEFDQFLADLRRESRARRAWRHGQPFSVRRRSKATCCLFISHRQYDINAALRIAWLATHAGYDYWLDIHDPALIAVNGASIASPAKDILVAAIIEIALLNSTHVIALHTQHSIGPRPNNLSKWIPYELGRAKGRQLRSDQAACWFDRHTPVSACGEYVHLTRKTWTEADITGWLSKAYRARCMPTSNTGWRYSIPPPIGP
jgi:hypothetical protein